MELEIGPGPETGSYITRVLQSVGGGEPSEQFSLDLDELLDRRPLLEASVLSSSVAARRVMSDYEAAIQDVGRTPVRCRRSRGALPPPTARAWPSPRSEA